MNKLIKKKIYKLIEILFKNKNVIKSTIFIVLN